MIYDTTGMDLDVGDLFVYVPGYSTQKTRIAKILEFINVDDPFVFKLKIAWIDAETLPGGPSAKTSVVTAKLNYSGYWNQAISLEYVDYIKDMFQLGDSQ